MYIENPDGGEPIFINDFNGVHPSGWKPKRKKNEYRPTPVPPYKPWTHRYNNPKMAGSPYDIQRVGVKSKYIFVRILDCLCSRQNTKLTIFTYIFSVNAGLSVWVYFPVSLYLGLYHDPDYWLFVFIYVIINFLIYLFAPQDYYRYFRHRYFKKHDLPGPYGWGTLDRDRNQSYLPEGLLSLYLLYYLFFTPTE